jgi:hypothetical protein
VETPAGRQLGRIAAEAGTDAHTTVAQRTEVVDRSPAAVVAATRLGSGARGRGSTRVVDGGFGKQESAGMSTRDVNRLRGLAGEKRRKERRQSCWR